MNNGSPSSEQRESSTVAREWLFETEEQLGYEFADYVTWYNNHRIHSSLGDLSLVNYRENNLKKLFSLVLTIQIIYSKRNIHLFLLNFKLLSKPLKLINPILKILSQLITQMVPSKELIIKLRSLGVLPLDTVVSIIGSPSVCSEARTFPPLLG